MKEFLVVIAVTVILGVWPVRGDVCDLCNCRKVFNDDCSISLRVDECWNGDSSSRRLDENDRKMNISLELDNIQWPVVNVSINAFFNHLKFTYLTKFVCRWIASQNSENFSKKSRSLFDFYEFFSKFS